MPELADFREHRGAFKNETGPPSERDKEMRMITKSILSVVPASISPGAQQIKASWRALPIECVELSRSVSYGD
jgi:hypothetical protein